MTHIELEIRIKEHLSKFDQEPFYDTASRIEGAIMEYISDSGYHWFWNDKNLTIVPNDENQEEDGFTHKESTTRIYYDGLEYTTRLSAPIKALGFLFRTKELTVFLEQEVSTKFKGLDIYSWKE